MAFGDCGGGRGGGTPDPRCSHKGSNFAQVRTRSQACAGHHCETAVDGSVCRTQYSCVKRSNRQPIYDGTLAALWVQLAHQLDPLRARHLQRYSCIDRRVDDMHETSGGGKPGLTAWLIPRRNDSNELGVECHCEK